MRTRHLHRLVVVWLLAIAHGTAIRAQVAYPDHVIQNVAWSSGTHNTAVTQKILSPGSTSQPVEITGTAQAEFVSGTSIHLSPGFRAGQFSGNGQHFRARIDQSLGPVGDVVIIAPDPGTSITDNVIHVPKWEKFEIGVRLPQEYQDAIDRFFAHYYSNGVANDATQDSVDAAHDLNPYADDSLQLIMTLTRPDGTNTLKWGFFMKEGKWSTTSQLAQLVEYPTNSLHPYSIRFRIAPDQEGVWQFALSIGAPHTADLANYALTTLNYSGYTFICDPSLPDNKGPLSVNPNNRRSLWFEATEEPFFALGANMPGPSHNAIPGCGSTACWYSFYRRDHDEMKKTMRRLHAAGGNYLRMWLGRHVFAPEWVNIGVYDAYHAPRPCADTTGITKNGNCQFDCWAFDQILDTARLNNIYLQVCIDPAHPGGNYEDISWGSNPYVINFLEPERDSTGKYDLKKFFYKDGDPGNNTNGVFYYWKRKYKYIMSRWGYSVNLAVLEPFNEIDGLLTYREDDLDSATCCVCPENRLLWERDSALPGILNHWLTDITGHVRGQVDLTNPVTSPLGENKLFLVSFLNDQPANTNIPNYFLPFTNPAVDIMDIHYGMYPDRATQQGLPSSGLFGATENVRSFQNTYPYLNPDLSDRKPFNQGEFQHYTYVPFGTKTYMIEKFFHNYDVSFHNELWSSAFSGKFAAGTSWQYERIYWWKDALEKPPSDQLSNVWQVGQFSNIEGGVNHLDLGLQVDIPVVNKALYHHFKPLSDLLAHPSWTPYAFYNGNYTVNKTISSGGEVEAYYLKDSSKTVAMGWVHNMKAWVLNHYYLANSDTTQNLLGCTEPGDTAITLTGFLDTTDYYISWFPTRMNDTIHPVDTVRRSSNTGTLLLDLSTAPFGDTITYYLDSLHSDYAFIITLNPFLKSMTFAQEPEEGTSGSWDFVLYPNPARDALYLNFNEVAPKDILVTDVAGRRLIQVNRITGPVQELDIARLARGVYWVCVTNGADRKVKKLVIH